MPKKNTQTSSKTSTKETMSLLKAACKRSKPKKRDAFTSTFFSLEDVDLFLAQRKNDDPVNDPVIPQVSIAHDNLPDSNKSRNKPKKRVLQAASLSDILGVTRSVNPEPKETYSLGEDDSRVPEALRGYYSSLLQMRYELKEGIAALAKASLQEPSGNLARYNTSDNGSDYFEQEIALGVVTSEKETLDEIEAAIQRIFEGTYGICEITGKSIPKKRLEAVPFTRYSLEGQQQMEEMRKNRKTITVNNTFSPAEDDEESTAAYFSEDRDDEE